MASENEDLIAEFTGKGKAASKIISPNADLINQFVGPDKAVAPAEVNSPQPDYVPRDATGNPTGAPRSVGILPNVVSSPLPTDYLHKKYFDAVAEDYAAAKAQTSQGVDEIGKGLSASGIGNVAMGGLGQLISPVTPIIKAATEVIDRTLPGNPQGKGAGTGEKLGMILPIKGSGSFVKAQLPSNIAIERLIETIGKENLPEVVRRMKANPRISPIDVSNSALQVAQKLAVTEGEHQNILNQYSQKRVGGSADAVKTAFDDSLGVPVNALEKINTLKQNARDTGKTAIEPVIEKAKPVDVTPVVKHIDAVLKPGVTSVVSMGETLPGPRIKEELEQFRKLMTDDKSNRTDARELHQIQSALRAKAQDLLDSQSGQDRQIGHGLMNVRNKIVDAIDKSAPGYKEGLSKYANDMEIQEAFERGFSLFGKSTKMTNRPEFLIDELKNAKPEVKEALKEGGRIAVDSMTRGFKNSARKGEDLVASEFNAEKIKALYGEKEAKQLISKLQDEHAISTTDTKLYQNSQTAMRLKNDNKVPQPVDPNEFNLKKLLPYAAEGAAMFATGGQSYGAGAGAYLAAKSFNSHAITPAVNKYRSKQNTELTKLMTAEGIDRDMLIKVLEDRAAPPKSTLQIIKHLALPVLPP